jgi:NAD(P)H dehydrogenase (quinone)
MRALVVYAHPNPASFCHALLRRVEAELAACGHEVRVKDLYAEGFDPVLSGAELGALNDGRIPPSIQAEQELLVWAEALVFIYPLWWFGRPAILKGWFDKVLTHGFAFEYTEAGPRGLLRPDKALVIVTVGSDQQTYRRMQAEEVIVRPMTDGTLGFCGVGQVESLVLYGVPSVGDDERRAMLEQAAARIRAL